jgi:hypothetical protein
MKFSRVAADIAFALVAAVVTAGGLITAATYQSVSRSKGSCCSNRPGG